jgi:hypothetical protein
MKKLIFVIVLISNTSFGQTTLGLKADQSYSWDRNSSFEPSFLRARSIFLSDISAFKKGPGFYNNLKSLKNKSTFLNSNPPGYFFIIGYNSNQFIDGSRLNIATPAILPKSKYYNTINNILAGVRFPGEWEYGLLPFNSVLNNTRIPKYLLELYSGR